MRMREIGIGFGLTLMAMNATSQTVASSGTTGTVNNVPYISAATSASTTLGVSPITVSNGNVGIGTTSPELKTEISGAYGGPATSGASQTGLLRLSNTSYGYEAVLDFGGDTASPYAAWIQATNEANLSLTYPIALNPNGGNVGIGTTSPDKALHVSRGGIHLDMPGINWTNNQGLLITNSIDTAAGDTGAEIWHGDSGAWGSHLLIFSSYPQTSYIPSGGYMVFNTVSGNLGIGTTSPGAKLEVNGNVKLTTSSGASLTYADGTSQTTAWTGVLCGGDYAESVTASGDRTRYEPGDTLVIDSNAAEGFTKVAEPYSTLVAGIYSTKPGVVGRKSTDANQAKSEVPMAMVGIVPAKVSAENGTIRRGDLLVTSSALGHLMKGTDRSRMLGAVVAKALGTLDSGTGVIDVLVTLQ